MGSDYNPADYGWTEERIKRHAEDTFEINFGEIFWIAHRQFLESQGYRLRPRYQPGWVKSWTSTPGYRVEDAIKPNVSYLITNVVTNSLKYLR